MWNVLIVFGGVILSISALPVAPVTTQNILLNETLLPVLRQCSQEAVKSNPTVKPLCDLYVHVVQNQTNVNSNITEEFQGILQKPETDTKIFCTILSTFPGVRDYLRNQGSCERHCRTYDPNDKEFVLPLCRLILWRLQVQNSGQVSPEIVGDISAPATSAGPSGVEGVNLNATLTNTTAQEKQLGVKEVTLSPQKPALPVVTPPGSLINKVEIPPVVSMGSESISTSTRANEELPKNIVEEKPGEEPKINPEAPEIPEAPKSNQAEEKASTLEHPKPLEEKLVDNDEDQNDPNLKNLEEEMENENDYDNNSAEKEDNALIKGDQGNLNAGDEGLIFDKSEPKDTNIAANDGMEVVKQDPFQEEDESNFFTYFMCLMLMCILAYVVYHNKTKVLALVLEGRPSNQARNGRRKHTAAYRKLDSNLEEAITSSAASRTQQIIY
ncbi:hypothetical protein DMENIID0001_032840 [Sergentomyia squamirostris]